MHRWAVEGRLGWSPCSGRNWDVGWRSAIQSGSGQPASGWGVFGRGPSSMKTGQIPLPCPQGATQRQEAWHRHCGHLAVLFRPLCRGAAGGWAGECVPLDSWGGLETAWPSSPQAVSAGSCSSGFHPSASTLSPPGSSPSKSFCLPLARLSLLPLSLLLSQSFGPVCPQE